MTILTDADRFKLLVRAAASAINSELCIVTNMAWILRAERKPTPLELTILRTAAERLADQVVGLLRLSEGNAPIRIDLPKSPSKVALIASTREPLITAKLPPK